MRFFLSDLLLLELVPETDLALRRRRSFLLPFRRFSAPLFLEELHLAAIGELFIGFLADLSESHLDAVGDLFVDFFLTTLSFFSFFSLSSAPSADAACPAAKAGGCSIMDDGAPSAPAAPGP